MRCATIDEVAELLGDRFDRVIGETIASGFAERIASLAASLDELHHAIEDVDYQRQYGDERPALSPKIAEIRAILEDLPLAAAPRRTDAADEDRLGRDPQ